jgi:hypothetical protein
MEETTLTPEQKEMFVAQLKRQNTWFGRGRRLFNWAHHSSLVVSIVSSAAAAVVPQLQGLDSASQKNLASVLAAIGALVLTLDTTAGFGKRWRVCRLSESKTKELSFLLICGSRASFSIH